MQHILSFQNSYTQNRNFRSIPGLPNPTAAMEDVCDVLATSSDEEAALSCNIKLIITPPKTKNYSFF